MGGLRAVFGKELTDALRDRRAMVSALVFPLLGPMMMGLLFFGIERNYGGDDQLVLPVLGQSHAPALVSYLRDNGVKVVDGPADPAASVATKTHKVVLQIQSNFGEQFRRGQTAEVSLYADSSDTAAAGDRRKAETLVNAWAARLAGTRLLARGVSPQIVQPVRIAHMDMATPRRHSANLLHVIALFVILAVFIGGMQVAIDTTAGERERGSLEALLLTPVPASTLVGGKWLVSLVFGAVSATLTLLVAAVILPLVPLENVGLVLHLGAAESLWMLAIVLPLAPLAAAAQLLVATFARSFKEAQTYLSLLLFVPMLPGFFAQILGITTAPWMMPVPALAQQVLIGDLLRGEAIAWSSLLVAASSSCALAWACLAVTARLFRRERIIFTGQ